MTQISPVNTSDVLGAFVKGAKKEMLIYDPEISDRMMLRILQNRVKAEVEICVISVSRPDVRRICVCEMP